MDVLERPLQLLTGKGGVGKSSVVAALALHAARRGKRPLIVELGDRASLESVFAPSAIGYDPVEVARGVFAMNLEQTRAIHDYVVRFVKLTSIADRVTKNRALKRFFEAAPGVAETVTLAKLDALVDGRTDLRERRFDPVLVDLDSTGHALMLLELPRVLEGLLGRGPLRRAMRRAHALLDDAERTALHIVTVPADLVVEETLELVDRLRAEHSIRLGTLFINQAGAPPLAPSSVGRLPELMERARTARSEKLRQALEVASRAVEKHRIQEALRERLRRSTAMPVIVLPRLPRSMAPLEVVRELASFVAESAEIAS